MKMVCGFLLVLVVGCRGDAALPVVSTTSLPETGLEVDLGGPDRNGAYGYYITSTSGVHHGYRSLGRLRPDEIKHPTMESLGEGIFRLQWGESTTAAYAVIDAKNERFIKDSNQANPENQPFAQR